MSGPSTALTAEANTGPNAEIPQPAPPPAPSRQTFKCEKCGAAFEDEGAAAAHIQVCKGPDDVLEGASKPMSN